MIANITKIMRHQTQVLIASINNNGITGMVRVIPLLKAISMIVFFYCCALCNYLIMAINHDHTPEGDALPDVWFKFVPENTNLLVGAEVCASLVTAAAFLIMAIHPDRWRVYARVFYITGVLYLGRAVCLNMTLLPQANMKTKHLMCSPKIKNATWSMIFVRLKQAIFTNGMISQTTICGDYIYSGHTIGLTLAVLTLQEYTPKRFSWLPIIAAFGAAFSIFGVMTSRGHYTIDIAIAYYLSSRFFWWYHSAIEWGVQYDRFKFRGDWLTRIFWMPFLQYIEGTGGEGHHHHHHRSNHQYRLISDSENTKDNSGQMHEVISVPKCVE